MAENETPEPKPVDNIEKLYAFTAEIEGEERILTGITDRGLTMFVTAEKKDMFKLMDRTSQETANVTGKKVSLVVFERKEVEKVIEPKLVEIAKPPISV